MCFFQRPMEAPRTADNRFGSGLRKSGVDLAARRPEKWLAKREEFLPGVNYVTHLKRSLGSKCVRGCLEPRNLGAKR